MWPVHHVSLSRDLTLIIFMKLLRGGKGEYKIKYLSAVFMNVRAPRARDAAAA